MADTDDAESTPPVSNDANPLGLAVIVGLFALLWFGAGPRIFLVVVGFLIMIFLHELGHFVTARWTGMKATQFFLFMGPRIWSFRRGETEYGVRLLPIGAFVRILGMNNLDPVLPEDESRAYMNKSYPRRMLVITAGSMMHFVQALLLFVFISSFVGVERWSVEAVVPVGADGDTSPAATAALEQGDRVLAVDGVSVVDWDDFTQVIRDRPGRDVTVTIERDDQVFDRSTTLASVDSDDGTVGFIGVDPAFELRTVGPMAGVETFGENFWRVLTVVPTMLSPSTLGDLARLTFAGGDIPEIDSAEAQGLPMSVVGAVATAGRPGMDLSWPLSTLALINLFVGIFNLVPLLPLDGGHAAIATYERLRSRNGRQYRADVVKLLPLTYAFVMLLGFLMVSTVYLDVGRLIG